MYKNYKFAKKILEVVGDGDRKDELAVLVRALKVEEIEQMRQFVRECEDAGYGLIWREE